jgi:Holliday junction DNA helicase RuvA
MIEYLRGNVVKRHAKGIVLESGGVGYGLELPLGALCEIDLSAKNVSFWIHTRVREDQLKLFGFSTWEEKEVFEILISLNGVGPKVALAILSTMSLGMLKNCVENKRIDLLQMVPGIGKRTAEKMLVELQSKLDKISSIGGASSFSEITSEQKSLNFIDSDPDQDSQVLDGFSEVVSDVKSALINLGFKEKDISKVSALKQLSNDSSDEVEFSGLLRTSLVELRGNISKGQSKKVKKTEKSSAIDEASLF